MNQEHFPDEKSAREYWEEQAVSSDDPLKVVRTLPEDTPQFIIDIFGEFEANVARFCFEGFSGVVLDAGCGTGEILIQALKVYPQLNIRYVGLDFSANILKIAADRVKSDAAFFQGSVTSLPFKDNTFERVICSGVIWYLSSLDDVGNLLREVRRILKPEGILIIDSLNRFSPSIMVTSILRLSDTKPPRYVSPFWFLKELKKNGFTVASYRGFNFVLFVGYRYLLLGKWRIFDPGFIQERWSRFVENKIVPHFDTLSFLGHRVYIKCQK